MGLFQRKKKAVTADDIIAAEHDFFDEVFREELRNHGRWYFEKIINENGDHFKDELAKTIETVDAELKTHVVSQLDATIAAMNSDIKEHVSQQLEAQFLETGKAIKEAQSVTLDTMRRTAEMMHQEHQQLTESLKKSAADQQAMVNSVFEENKAWSSSMKDTQAAALQWLHQSAQAMEEQKKQLDESLQKNAEAQQSLLVAAFERQMAQVIEHYVLEAISDQYDLKAQLPAIITQLEANKDAIVRDMSA